MISLLKTKTRIVVASLAVTSMLAGCSKDDDSSSDNGDGFKGPRGNVQGVIIDGLTNQPVKVPNAEGEQGVRVLAHNNFINANSAAAKNGVAEDSSFLAGEYHIGKIPLDETLPIFVDIPGYHKFQSYVYVSSTKAQYTTDSEASDIVRMNPTEIANIVVFPIGHKVEDLNLTVVSNAETIEGAEVRLTYNNRNILNNQAGSVNYDGQGKPQGSFFLSPANTRVGSFTALTDVDGKVVFAKDQLVLGGQYTATIIPPQGYEGTALTTTTEITVGLINDGALALDDNNPFTMIVDIDTKNAPLALVSSSVRQAIPEQSGKLVLLFNRPIELAAGSMTGMSAELVGGGVAIGVEQPEETNEKKAQLRADDASTVDVNETINYRIEGNRLILTPNWEVSPNFAKEPGLQINYTGINLVPASGNNRNPYSVTGSDATVRFK